MENSMDTEAHEPSEGNSRKTFQMEFDYGPCQVKPQGEVKHSNCEISASLGMAIPSAVSPTSGAVSEPVQKIDDSQQLQSNIHNQQLQYWMKKLETSRAAVLLFDHPQSAIVSEQTAVRPFQINDILRHQLKAYCEQQKLTAFAVLLAAFRATHYRLTGDADATIGAVKRSCHAQNSDNVDVPLSDLRCIRTTIENETFIQLSHQVLKVVIEADENSSVRFEDILLHLHALQGSSRHSLVQILYVMADESESETAAMEDMKLDEFCPPSFHLAMYLHQDSSGLRGEIRYSPALFETGTIVDLISIFLTILHEGLAEPSVMIATIPLLAADDYSRLNALDLIHIQKTSYPRESSVIDAFHLQVLAAPGKLAVKDETSQLTYTELDQRSNVVAEWLMLKSLPAETLVGILAHRSCEAVIAMLGVLKANLAYLPLDGKTPSGRTEVILAAVPGHKIILVGSDDLKSSVQVKDGDVEVVRIADILKGEDHGRSEIVNSRVWPSATSLAYVMFTSGSTGNPKGVMVEHRSIVRLGMQNNMVQHHSPSSTIAHIASIAFDMSTWEIFTSLLNGGTLICISTVALLDCPTMADIISREQIQVMLITPALLKRYLHGCPEAISTLNALYVGGDRSDPQDLAVAQRLIRGNVINAYGPTENTGASTVHCLSSTATEAFANGVPIGKALSNSGAYVMDPHQRLVPLGVVGELVVTGDGLARGYLDPQQNTNRFITAEIAGNHVRAYRTGDFVRHRPTDGLLEFFGRMDQQVKIRGQRVELGEIDHILSAHDCVKEVATVLLDGEDDLSQISSFVTILKSDTQLDERPRDDFESESKLVEDWKQRIDTETYIFFEGIRPELMGKDFVGWTSMYDGTEIDKEEMCEWLDDTMKTIINGEPPGHVLEIGTGSGMILFNLIDEFQSYTGLEPSGRVADYVKEMMKSIPGSAHEVNIYKATAADLNQLPISISPNTVILNSVIQYFPSLDYLLRLIHDILQLEEVRTIFFGDVRSYALYREFLTARALRIAGESAKKDDIRGIMASLEQAEMELLVDPAFFVGLQSLLPDRIYHVEILPKRMQATNELSCYRYAAVLHVKSRTTPQREVHELDDNEWVDFAARQLDRESLARLLKQASISTPVIGVYNISNRKSAFEKGVVDSLCTHSDDGFDLNWIRAVRQKVDMIPSLSAKDLVSLAEEAGYRVEISWARQFQQRGAMDAVFHRHTQSGECRTLFRFPISKTNAGLRSLGTQPLQTQRTKSIQMELKKMLQEKLPPYMVPQSVLVLEKMPLNTNGKIDRQALAHSSQPRITARRQVDRQSSSIEWKIQQIWGEVLKIDPSEIDAGHDFFMLGGNSIAAMTMVAGAHKAGINLKVEDLFRHPILMDLACQSTETIHDFPLDTKPFDLLGDEIDVAATLRDISGHYHLDPSTVQDAYPCTPLQEGLIAISSMHSGTYTMQVVLEVSDDIGIADLCKAWETVVHATPILRTRIVQHQTLGVIQIVLSDHVHWIDATDLDEYLDTDRKQIMALGQPLSRHAIVKDVGTRTWFVWTVHHSLFDAWSMHLIIDAVSRAYHGGDTLGEVAGTHFSRFIRYIQLQDDMKTTDFWRQTLKDYGSVPYPSLSSPAKRSIADSVVECSIANPKYKRSGVTTAILVRTALALVVGKMSDSDDVVFGVTVSGRSAAVERLDKLVGPTIATVPVRIQLEQNKKVSELLEMVQQQATDMIPFEQSGLQKIATTCPEAERACGFQLLLVVQPQNDDGSDSFISKNMLGTWRDGSSKHWSDTHPLTIEVRLGTQEIVVSAIFKSDVIDRWTVQKMMQRLRFAVHQLDIASPEKTLRQVDMVTEEDLQQIWTWNGIVPPAIHSDIYDGIARWKKTDPDAPAVCAWDGNLTYAVLDQLVTQLARKLAASGIAHNCLVSLCFNKSMWTAVAMLGVIRAGGGFILLDPSLPEQRLLAAVRQAQPRLILTSAVNQALASRLVNQTVTLDWDFFSELDKEHGMDEQLQPSSPSSIAYIIFTSGSTGEPKGVQISHGNLSSALHHQASSFAFSSSSRIYDFVSYSFDVCIEDVFAVLHAGGCICVPSDDDRRGNLEQSIKSLRANTLQLTPSVIPLISPDNLPGVHTIILGGEALRVADILPWWGKVRILNTYGPSECTPASTINSDATCPEDVMNIGKGTGLVTWIVNPANSDELAPPGCVGELLLEGPLVGDGYLNDDNRTMAAFVEDLPWLLRGATGRPGRHGRLYKTGDLVRYGDETGKLIFVGRKDTQVKVRGQRVEMGEIEHWVKVLVSEASQVAVEAVLLPPGHGSTSDSMLIVAFLQIDSQLIEKSDVTATDAKVYSSSLALADQLIDHLPSYMVPTHFLSLKSLPMTATGKLNRSRLRDLGATFAAEQLSKTRSPLPVRQPTSEAELLLQDIWARVLGIDAIKIGLDDHFFRLGGNSIAAMRLAAEARKVGVLIEVKEIFRNPILSQQARNQPIKELPTTIRPIPAFSMLSSTKQNLCEEIASHCGLEAVQVEDAYPCTPLQEGLISLTAKRHGDYTLRAILELAGDVNISAFKGAWEKVVQLHAILRTRIIQHEQHGLLQVVLADQGIDWIDATDLNAYLQNDRKQPMGLGKSLTHFSLVKNSSGEIQWFVWTVHHALYDGWSMNLITDAAKRAYQGASIIPGPQFQTFLHYIREQNLAEAEKYWQNTLANCDCVQFPASPPSVDQPVPETKVEYQFPHLLQQCSKDITRSNLIRAAWALIASQMSDTNDVVFGATVSGRNAPVPNIDRMVAPTFATVPVRIQLDRNQTVADYLHAIQLQATDMIPFEQSGLQRIAKISPHCANACSFQTLVVVEAHDTATSTDPDDRWKWQDDNTREAFSAYALVIQVIVSKDHTAVSAVFDNKIIQTWVVERLLRRLQHVLEQLDSPVMYQKKVKDIAMITPEELDLVWGWNRTVPSSADRCVLDIFEARVRSQPHAPAVCAWDGEHSYRELSRLSTGLAVRLIRLGVQEGNIIPLCFEKSLWTTVAIMGVLKSGASFVLLDPSLPEHRLRSMVKQTRAKMMISSHVNHALSTKLNLRVVTIDDPDSLSASCDSPEPTLPRPAKPSSTMYVVFTSGSTGTPKGTVITHGNMSSALAHQAERLGLTASSRLYDFSPYGFDMSICNVFVTLALGCCLCVPRDSDRHNRLAESIAEMEATSVILTPSVARLLRPEQMPKLKSVMFIGESLHVHDVDRWSKSVRIINLYGPCECTPISTINDTQDESEFIVPRREMATCIGMGAGSVTWVVDAEDHSMLLPPGCVGELLLEGPLVGDGYLHDAERTAASFIKDPSWLTQHPQYGRQGRLYKTGDMVRYNEDGNLVFVGRKDVQIKINGQRVESGEVEHWVQRCMPSARQVAVEMIYPRGEHSIPMLVAFVETEA
ncbi:NRPS protein [Claviceps humidiphila]|uniref:D-lysergyl-peptide-synthetase subunit 1 n=1 Tax=Claviceps humidiphila TaxID=1294629 RepID=A0A9P7Q693_9HYPO|nr:NRPS protein [Claviceps humidiphila]